MSYHSSDGKCLFILICIILSFWMLAAEDELISDKNDGDKNQTQFQTGDQNLTINAALEEEFLAKLEQVSDEHPHLKPLVERVKLREKEAKEELEKQSLSIKYNQMKAQSNSSDSEIDIVLNFIDDYVMEVTGAKERNEPFMKLQDLMSLVEMSEKLKAQIHELANKLERAQCGSECLGNEMGEIMNEAIGQLMGSAMPKFDDEQFDDQSKFGDYLNDDKPVDEITNDNSEEQEKQESEDVNLKEPTESESLDSKKSDDNPESNDVDGASEKKAEL